MILVKKSRIVVLILVCCILSGCCSTSMNNKRTTNDDFIKTEMYLAATGQNNVEASEQQWADFKKNEIAQRFPDGFSVYNVNGAWKTKEGNVHLNIKTWVLIIVRKNTPEDHKKIEEIATEYKKKFNLEAVMITHTKTDLKFI